MPESAHPIESERRQAPDRRAGARQRTPGSLRNRYLLTLDLLVLPAATWFAFAIRFEGATWPRGMASVYLAFCLIVTPLKLVLMWRMGLYRRMWRYASVGDLRYLAGALTGAGFASLVVGLAIVPLIFSIAANGLVRVPLSVVALDALLGGAFVAVPRMSVRMGLSRPRASQATTNRRALIIGAGAAGAMIARELLDNPQLGLAPAAFLDDDPSKVRRRLHDVEVVGGLADLGRRLASGGIDEIIIAMPTAPGRIVRDIVRQASEVGIPTRTVPGLFELISGEKAVSTLRKVEIGDLLRREPVVADSAPVDKLAAGRTVLVTGAGGSIGSELCRQIAQLKPKCIVALGRGENSIFELLEDLRRLAPDAVVHPVIADIRDEARIEQVFRTFRPHTVFHAAAHKHVPLMEANVAEAIINNVVGTRVVADAAWRHGTDRFVLISSDKAVRPSSVMGATKRLAEGVVQRYTDDPNRHFVSVRFGNVLGSRGSVVPTFLRQIQAGGPVTITHRDMRRFFMTIPEAVQLVLQAGTLAEDGEVFVLDMGEPVKIYDLARDIIRLSGLEVGADIEIRETGMRPGEKLYEELFFDAENATPTAHPKVLRSSNARLSLHGPVDLDDLITLARRNAPAAELRNAIKCLVPEYSGAEIPASARVAAGSVASGPMMAGHDGAPKGSTSMRLAAPAAS